MWIIVFCFWREKTLKDNIACTLRMSKSALFAGSIIGFDPYPYTYIMHIFCYIKSLKCQPKPWLMINYYCRVQAWKYLWRTCHRLHIYQSWLLLSHLSLILSPSPSLSMYNHIHNIFPWFMTHQMALATRTSNNDGAGYNILLLEQSHIPPQNGCRSSNLSLSVLTV